jgi:high-affinity Fe2+/Pb2+ permease
MKVDRVQSIFERTNEAIQSVVGPFLFALVVYAVARVVMEKATAIHWVFGAVVATLIALLLLWLLLWLNRSLGKKQPSEHPARVMLSIFLLMVLVGAAVCAQASYLFHSKHWATYTAVKDLQLGRVVDYYMWVFIDMIPGIDAWKTLNVRPPLEPVDFLAGLPILLFRIFVVYGVLICFDKWYQNRPGQREKAAGC